MECSDAHDHTVGDGEQQTDVLQSQEQSGTVNYAARGYDCCDADTVDKPPRDSGPGNARNGHGRVAGGEQVEGMLRIEIQGPCCLRQVHAGVQQQMGDEKPHDVRATPDHSGLCPLLQFGLDDCVVLGKVLRVGVDTQSLLEDFQGGGRVPV
ncbi:hypothetical protein [Actinomadura sp. BRA 177]|uniref:hypothetical protein n=1 Tax=Actinomadura sp. BRA 177 TaxID=2745202 RepID=UPI001595719F|nr:hypothetical protein [Actinomadura sp. BRA 177]NVI87840.1 hypothetical protein [Actinomadura sp. BRA 177]